MNTSGKMSIDELQLFQKIEDIAQELDGRLVASKTVSTGKFSYDYLPLEDLESMLRPLLVAEDLMLDYPQDHGCQGARIIDLATGAFKASWVPLAPSEDIQSNGKQLTYDARYALLMGVLGRRASKDDDGAGQKGGTTKRKQKSAPPSGGFDDLF